MKRNYFTLFFILSIFFTFSTVYSQWVQVGSTLSGLGTFPSISTPSSNVVWVAGGVSGGSTGAPVVYRSVNGGTTFTSAVGTGLNPTKSLFCVWGVDSMTAFVGDGGDPGGVTGGNALYYRTTDGGVTWTQVGSTGGTAGFMNGIVFSKTMPTFGVAQSDPPTGAGNPYYLGVSSNGGANWTATAPTGFTGTASAQNSIVVIDNTFFGWGSNSTPPAVILTTDGGTTWNKRNTSITGTFTSGVAFADDKKTGLIGSSTSLPNIARTTDAGVTFSIVSTGTGLSGYCNLKWINNTNTCYVSGAAGTAGLVKKSTTGGTTWTQMTTPSGYTNITHMEFCRTGTTVTGYAINGTGQVIRLSETVTGIQTINSMIPDNYKLEQNYPNPFNPATTILFSIPQSSFVTLKVYDLLGKEVSILVNENKQAGNYSLNLNASGLASGTYIYRLSAGNFTDSKKLIISK